MYRATHNVLVIWIKFPPKHYQVILLLTRKACKASKMPRNSYNLCWGYKTLPLVDYLDRKRCFRSFCHTKFMADFCFTDNSQVSQLFRLATPISPWLRFLVCDSQNQKPTNGNAQQRCQHNNQKKKMADGHVTVVWSLNPWISCG